MDNTGQLGASATAPSSLALRPTVSRKTQLMFLIDGPAFVGRLPSIQ